MQATWVLINLQRWCSQRNQKLNRIRLLCKNNSNTQWARHFPLITHVIKSMTMRWLISIFKIWFSSTESALVLATYLTSLIKSIRIVSSCWRILGKLRICGWWECVMVMGWMAIRPQITSRKHSLQTLNSWIVYCKMNSEKINPHLINLIFCLHLLTLSLEKYWRPVEGPRVWLRSIRYLTGWPQTPLILLTGLRPTLVGCCLLLLKSMSPCN